MMNRSLRSAGALYRSCIVLAVLTLALAACGQPAGSGGGKTAWPGPFTAPRASPTPPPPLSLPRDEAPHDALTEWWYYTGHLQTADGASYGFESVIFQSRRGDFPPLFAAHVAITDQQRATFQYDQRTGAARVGTPPGFDLQLGDWSWRGFEGRDTLVAQLPDYRFRLDLRAEKPPALHGGGYVDFGPAGGSYYYSRTRMSLRGTLEDRGTSQEVTGEAWFDHQWGNFLGLGPGGWDWFSAQLADGSDFTFSLLRAGGQQVVGGYGSYIEPDGRLVPLAMSDFQVEVLSTWTSPQTGVTYPASWRVTLPRQQLALTITPSLPDQELDTRASTGTIYWEGDVRITGTRAGAPIAGAGYVELTGYDQR